MGRRDERGEVAGEESFTKGVSMRPPAHAPITVVGYSGAINLHRQSAPVTQPTAFGRRSASAAPALRPSPAVGVALSPEAEAFVAELKAAPPHQAEDFAAWRRASRAQRLLIWGLGAVLLAPGLLCFLLQLPREISGGLELAGMAGNVWLRYDRRRRIKAIAAWEQPTA